MNPRQRRGVILMVVAGLGALAVFFMVLGYVGNVRSQANAEVGEMTTVLQLQTAIPARSAITPEDVKSVQIPKRWFNDGFVTDPAGLNGEIAASDLTAGVYLQKGMLTAAPQLKQGQREIAIMIDAETGVAGQVQPGDVVDVYATFDPASSASSATPACALRVLNRVQVLQVGRMVSQADAKNQTVTDSVVPITFALNPNDTLKLTYAESFADKVRLALVGGTTDPAPPSNKLCQTPLAVP